MTVQYAIRYLEKNEHVSVADEVLDICLEALRRQVPKEPTETHEIQDGTFYRIDFMCPSCNTSVVCQPYKPNYCKHCGQKLDWKEGVTDECS